MYRFLLKASRCPLSTRSYGIIAQESFGDSWHFVAFVPGISEDKAFVLDLAEKCTRGQLNPIQLLDVVMDALH